MTKSLVVKQPIMVTLLVALIYGYAIKTLFSHYGSGLFWLSFSFITIFCAYFTKRVSFQMVVGAVIGAILMIGLAFIALNDPLVPQPSNGLFPYALFLWSLYGGILGAMSGFIAVSIKKFSNM